MDSWAKQHDFKKKTKFYVHLKTFIEISLEFDNESLDSDLM